MTSHGTVTVPVNSLSLPVSTVTVTVTAGAGPAGRFAAAQPGYSTAVPRHWQCEVCPGLRTVWLNFKQGHLTQAPTPSVRPALPGPGTVLRPPAGEAAAELQLCCNRPCAFVKQRSKP